MTTEPVPVEQQIHLKELEVRLREIDVSKELAQLGLRGALTGAIAGCLMVIVLAVIAAFSEKVQITGTHLCWMMGIVAVAVALYGAFVFNRSLGISGDFRNRRFDVTTSDLGAASAERRKPTRARGGAGGGTQPST